MLKNPSTYFKAQQEVDRVVGKGNLTVDHLKDLKYINAILRETLRLTPTAPVCGILRTVVVGRSNPLQAFTRKVRDENHENPPTLGKGEYELKKEWGMLCLIGKIQRDPKVYGDDAEEFSKCRGTYPFDIICDSLTIPFQ
jgi:cytochrome P450/NADPH-cytochrome P450 reductase